MTVNMLPVCPVWCSLAPAVARSVLPFDGSCEEVEDAELAAVSGLTFLQG
jgi:hypothetical protein